MGLSAQAIADEVAQVATVIVENTPPADDYAQSLTFPQGYFGREVIERVEVVWGLRRVTVPNVVFEINFNLNQFPPFAEGVRRSLVSAMRPFWKSRGCVPQDTPEGIVVLLGSG